MLCKLLIIDDSPMVHRVLTFQLRRGGFILEHAFCAEEGIKKVETFEPDVILLDMVLPDQTGIEACQTLKNDEKTKQIPIIFLTSDAETETKVKALDVGGADYITKPFVPAELKARIRAAHRMKRLLDLLSRRAQIDGLTGLWNRAHFDERLADEVDAANRYGRDFTLVMMDIDHFKMCNDTYGHLFGDHVLERVGHVLHEATRKSDIAFRYGGEEFAILLRETHAEAAQCAIERYIDQIREMTFVHQGKQIKITASFGFVDTILCPKPVCVHNIVALADEALYRAKENGRDRYEAATTCPVARPPDVELRGH